MATEEKSDNSGSESESPDFDDDDDEVDEKSTRKKASKFYTVLVWTNFVVSTGNY